MNSILDITPTVIFQSKFLLIVHLLSIFYLWRVDYIYENNFVCEIKIFFCLHFQKALPVLSTYVRNISADSTSLKDVLASKIPEEIENVKAFRKSHGSTKVGEVTVDMVSSIMINRKICGSTWIWLALNWIVRSITSPFKIVIRYVYATWVSFNWIFLLNYI